MAYYDPYAEGTPTRKAQDKMIANIGNTANIMGKGAGVIIKRGLPLGSGLGVAGQAIDLASQAIAVPFNRIKADYQGEKEVLATGKTADQRVSSIAEKLPQVSQNGMVNISPNTTPGSGNVLNVAPGSQVSSPSPVIRPSIATGATEQPGANQQLTGTSQEIGNPLTPGSGIITDPNTGQMIAGHFQNGASPDTPQPYVVGSGVSGGSQSSSNSGSRNNAMIFPTEPIGESGPLNTFTDIMNEKARRSLYKLNSEAKNANDRNRVAAGAESSSSSNSSSTPTDTSGTPMSMAQASNVAAETELRNSQAIAARNMASLQNEYLNPKTTPARQQEIAKQITDMQGKRENYKIATEKSVDPKTMMPIEQTYVIDSSGNARPIKSMVQGGQSSQTSPTPVKGQTAKTKDGKNVVFDGKGWVLQ